MNSLSEKQLWRMKKIEQQLGVRFRGQTAKGANQFLWRFIDLSKQIEIGAVTNDAAWRAFCRKEEELDWKH